MPWMLEMVGNQLEEQCSLCVLWHSVADLLFRGTPSRKRFLRVIPTLTHYILTYFLTCHHLDVFMEFMAYNMYNNIHIYIYSNILSGSFWHMYLAHLLSFFLTFYLVYLRRFFVVGVRRRTLWSGARGWRPAGNTLIRSLRWRCGGEHFDPEVAVGVWQGTLRSRACSWSPAEEGGRRREEGGRRRAGWRKISQPSPDRWGKTEVFQNGTRICYVLSVLPALAAVTFEQHGVA